MVNNNIQSIEASNYVPPQIGGSHYENKSIQPIQFIEANNLGFHEGNAIKYIVRHKEKNGVEDLKKALWYIERLIQIQEGGNKVKPLHNFKTIKDNI